MPCYIERTQSGDTMFLCGKFGPRCAAEKCAAVSLNLCDFPVAAGRTCDLPLCDSQAYQVAPNVHYCPGHLMLWKEFRRAGAVDRELSNVMPFPARMGKPQNGKLF